MYVRMYISMRLSSILSISSFQFHPFNFIVFFHCTITLSLSHTHSHTHKILFNDLNSLSLYSTSHPVAATGCTSQSAIESRHAHATWLLFADLWGHRQADAHLRQTNEQCRGPITVHTSEMQMIGTDLIDRSMITYSRTRFNSRTFS